MVDTRWHCYLIDILRIFENMNINYNTRFVGHAHVILLLDMFIMEREMLIGSHLKHQNIPVSCMIR